MLAGQGGADHASGQGGSWKEGGGDAAGGGDEEGEVNSLEISEISKSSIGSQRSQKILLDPTLTLTMHYRLRCPIGFLNVQKKYSFCPLQI